MVNQSQDDAGRDMETAKDRVYHAQKDLAQAAHRKAEAAKEEAREAEKVANQAEGGSEEYGD